MGLHPLIHTLLEFNLEQDVRFCQRGAKKPYLPLQLRPMGAISEWVGISHQESLSCCPTRWTPYHKGGGGWKKMKLRGKHVNHSP